MPTLQPNPKKKQKTQHLFYEMNKSVLGESDSMLLVFPKLSTCSLQRHCEVISFPPPDIFLDPLGRCESH